MNKHTVKTAYQDFIKESVYFSKTEQANISYELYSSILFTFMDVILMFVVHGFTVCLPRHLGVLKVKIVKRSFLKHNGKLKLSPDWATSNANKKEIVDRGGLPYEEWWDLGGVKLEDKVDGAIRMNNGGEKWLVYYTDEYYYKIMWLKSRLKFTDDAVYKAKLWHLIGYTFGFVRDLKRAAFKEIGDLPSYYFNHANNNNEIAISECIQKFRDSRWQLDKRRY